MPSLSELARFFASLTTADVLIGVAITGSILLLVSDWRFSLVALAAQYLLITILLSTIVQLEVALVRLISGGLVACILFMTAWRVRGQWMRRARAAGWRDVQEIAALFEREPFLAGVPFRATALVLVGVSVIAVSTQSPFLTAPPAFWALSLWLCSVGLLLVAFSRDALKVGLGVLTFSSGFGALYLAIEPSLLFYGLLMISDLIVGLGVAHLASAPARKGTETRRRGES